MLPTRHHPGHHSQPPPDLLAVNGFLAALAATPATELAPWWPQQRCQATWGRLIQPSRFGHWREHDTVVGFLLECHRHEQPTSDLIATLAD